MRSSDRSRTIAAAGVLGALVHGYDTSFTSPSTLQAHIPRTQAQSGRKLRLTLNRTLLDGLIQEDPRQRLYGLDVSRTALTQAIYIL
eukprot:g28319.t1